VIWSRAFEKLFDTDGSGDRAKRLGTNVLDPRYRCLLEAGDALRSFDPAAHARVRAGLERLTAIDPNFAAGFNILAALYGREYITGFGARPGDTPPLERALKAARRGIELKPQSARGYHILFAVLFFRGETDAAIAAAEKAIALNPYDVLISTEFAGRLIYAGEVDRGMTMLRDAVGFGAILPAWSHFALFVGHYVRGEMVEARSQASQLTSETYVYGQLARALVARLDGDEAEVARARQAIVALQPAWADDPRREMGKVIIAPAIADRLAADFTCDRNS
jgi:tetratricopeptide (TPR) repeat protein